MLNHADLSALSSRLTDKTAIDLEGLLVFGKAKRRLCIDLSASL